MGDTEEIKGTFDNNPPSGDDSGKSGDDSGKSGDDSGKIRKIHANWIIFLLVLIGCAVLPICIIAGIWIVQKIGGWVIGWECLGIDDPSNNIYFTDFLGGALGFMVGFILDKFVIERINNVLHYKALVRVVRQELNYIQNAAEGFEKEFKNGNTIDIKEYILDDVVMTAETMSVIANIPFATKQVKQLTEVLSNIQKYFELYCGSIRKINEFLDVYIKGEFPPEKVKSIMKNLIDENVQDNAINNIMKGSSDDEIPEEQKNDEKRTNNTAPELKETEQAQTNKDNSREQALHTCRKDIPSISTYGKILIEHIDKAKLIV